MTTDVTVVGAGISGIACAQELKTAGIDARVVDRGRRIGGRIASKRLQERPVDLGASYFTVSDPDFQAVVDGWRDRGLAREWTDTFIALGDDETEVKSGPMRWGAQTGLRALVEDLATGLSVEQQHLDSVEAGHVVLAMPDPQASRLLPTDHPAQAHLTREFEPVLALAARWPERTWDGISPTGRFDGAFVNDHDVLAWVADDGRRRGDDAPVLVAHTTPAYAAQHLEDPQAAGPELARALAQRMGLDEPTDTHVHRWSLARPVGDRDEPYALVMSDLGLVGICGDGWGATPKVETAWLSGRALGRALVERLR